MILKNKTILITGGSSGIGLELAAQLVQKNNKVIICGRSQEKLDKAISRIHELITIPCDISDLESCYNLIREISRNHSECSILVNNAAIVNRTSFYDDPDIPEKAVEEIAVNLLGPIFLSKLMIPILENNPEPAIINVTTGLVYAAKGAYPFYNATKSGLHAFTETLRLQLNDRLKVTEVLFPVVDTPWHQGTVPEGAISSGKAAAMMINGIESGKQVVRIGKVKMLYWLSRIAPGVASAVINRM